MMENHVGSTVKDTTYRATCGCGQFLHEHDDQVCRKELWSDIEALWGWVEVLPYAFGGMVTGTIIGLIIIL